MALSHLHFAEARKIYTTYWESYLTGNLDASVNPIDDKLLLIGTSESEVSFGQTDRVALLMAQFDEVEDKVERRKKQGNEFPVGDMPDVIGFCDIYVLIDTGWSYYSNSRHARRKNSINVKMDFDLDKNLGDVCIIGEDSSCLMRNQANNAFDVMYEKTKIETNYGHVLKIGTIQMEKALEISIVDNGPGIPVEIRDKILQPFFTTKQGSKGTGLGFSINDDIVKAHGGALRIDSSTVEGIVFTIYISEQ